MAYSIFALISLSATSSKFASPSCVSEMRVVARVAREPESRGKGRVKGVSDAWEIGPPPAPGRPRATAHVPSAPAAVRTTEFGKLVRLAQGAQLFQKTVLKARQVACPAKQHNVAGQGCAQLNRGWTSVACATVRPAGVPLRPPHALLRMSIGDRRSASRISRWMLSPASSSSKSASAAWTRTDASSCRLLRLARVYRSGLGVRDGCGRGGGGWWRRWRQNSNNKEGTARLKKKKKKLTGHHPRRGHTPGRRARQCLRSRRRWPLLRHPRPQRPL